MTTAQNAFRLPNATQRLTIVGRTGSGKTVAGAWALSHAAYDKQPYIIFDYKGDELLQAIPYLEEIDLKSSLPKHPGLYSIRINPTDNDAVRDYLHKIWQREKIGLFFDEMYVLPDSNAQGRGPLQAILTQGRSKRIPVIMLMQRPAFVTKFAFSEADFFSVFHLTQASDIERMKDMTPLRVEQRLPDFHSRYYDVVKDRSYVLRPVPDQDIILDTFATRLKPKKRII